MGPVDWLSYLGRPVADPGRVTVIDSNLSTFTADADKVIRVDEPDPWIELIELQAGRNVRLDKRSHGYSTLLEGRHLMPVRTTIVLLRPAADGPELTGKLELRYRSGEVYDTFLYHVVRVWEQPVESVLACGLTVLPLAPVSRVEPEDVRGVLLAISKRLEREATPELAATLWGATRILMGLRYEEEQVEAMIQGVSAMLFGIHGIEESTVYQGILRRGRAEGRAEGEAEGRLEEDRRILLSLGREKLGPPDERVEARIAAITDQVQLYHLLHGLLRVSNWDDLLASVDS